jgi:hypothetical protein
VVSGDLPESPVYFCGKTPAEFGVNVYRKSTGVMVLGKPAAKHLRFLPGEASYLNASPLQPFPACNTRLYFEFHEIALMRAQAGQSFELRPNVIGRYSQIPML